ncbi:hypothetical protein Pmani_038978 [Petrolisthes manimaculis]|uniref:Uncharacterized protein n=1 Tax=Petrolisthes manimaculis TaxID=1843537 RepID=A0AAE1NEL8_9EUCA|nr:hypothetical protein Pmani_038978 [Petrolisthes manimaculis]
MSPGCGCPASPPRAFPGFSSLYRQLGMPRGSCIYLWCVCWVVVAAVAAAAGAHTDCAVRTDAKDVASKAYVSPQVVEAVVREVDRSAQPGRPYTVTLQVTKKLRAYSGRPRVKKSDNVTLTFRLPPTSDSGAGDNNPDTCLVTAALKLRHKYLLFLSGGGGRSATLHPVAPQTSPTRSCDASCARRSAKTAVSTMLMCGGAW